MEMALYGPGGYYTSRGRVGAGGDYYTSPSVHPVFGALMALQLEEMWRLLGRPSPFVVIEMGAGDGCLARDIVSYAQDMTPFSLLYIATDLAPGTPSDEAIHWLRSRGAPFRDVVGCVLSNELVDSFPVHQVTMAGGRVREVYVDLCQDSLVEVLGEVSSPAIGAYLEAAGIILEEGQRVEVCLEVEPWLRGVAEALERGFLLTIDYGYLQQDLSSPGLQGGTIVGYRRHDPTTHILERVGDQDITSLVNFSSLVLLGHKYGLEEQGLVSQRRFLTNLGLHTFRDALARQNPKDYYANGMAMLDLIREEGLGSFMVLIQSKNVGPCSLSGLTAGGPQKKRLASSPAGFLNVPLLGPQHTPLLAGKYPHLLWPAHGGDEE